jgi:hypothetical protein
MRAYITTTTVLLSIAFFVPITLGVNRYIAFHSTYTQNQVAISDEDVSLDSCIDEAVYYARSRWGDTGRVVPLEPLPISQTKYECYITTLNSSGPPGVSLELRDALLGTVLASYDFNMPSEKGRHVTNSIDQVDSLDYIDVSSSSFNLLQSGVQTYDVISPEEKDFLFKVGSFAVTNSSVVDVLGVDACSFSVKYFENSTLALLLKEESYIMADFSLYYFVSSPGLDAPYTIQYQPKGEGSCPASFLSAMTPLTVK